MNKDSSLSIKIITAAALILMAAFSFYVGFYLLSFIRQPEQFRLWISSFKAFAPLAYIFITCLQILIPIIPGEPMEMIAGYAFGPFNGTLLCILAESIASIIVLLIVRRFGRKIVEVFFSKEKINSLSFLKSSKNRIILYALIFIMPGTPKDLLCFFGGLTDIDQMILIPIITLGRLPSIITSTLTGDSFSLQRYDKVLIFIAITAILSLTGIITYRLIEKKNRS